MRGTFHIAAAAAMTAANALALSLGDFHGVYRSRNHSALKG